MSDTLSILCFEAGPVATNGYLVIDGTHAVIIDAPLESAELMIEQMDAMNLEPEALWLTHSHWDHTADVSKLKNRYPKMKVLIHQLDEYRLIEPMKHSVWPLPFTIEGATADGYLEHGQRLMFGSTPVTVLFTPGHTEGGVCFYFEGDNVIVVGDTLFAGSVGRTDLPGGNWETLSSSIIRELMVLNGDVRVLPGHGPETTIEAERTSNPYVQMDTRPI